MALKDISAKVSRYDGLPKVSVVQPRLAIDPPNGPITLPATEVVTIYDDTVRPYRLAYVHLQNVGTGTIKYALNSDVETGNYHEILAPGAADEDGLGASAEFSFFNIKKLTVLSDAGSKITVVLGLDTSKPNRAPEV